MYMYKKFIYVHHTRFAFLLWRLCEHETNVNMHLNITLQLHDYMIWKLSAQTNYFLHKKIQIIYFICQKNSWYGTCTCRTNLPASYWNLSNKISKTKSSHCQFLRETPQLNHQYQSHNDHFRGETRRNFTEKRSKFRQEISSFFSLFLREKKPIYHLLVLRRSAKYACFSLC